MPIDLEQSWQRAQLTEPFVVTSPTTNTPLGVFMLDADTTQILPLDPAKDFPDLKVSAWGLAFRANDQVLGLAAYLSALEQLRPYLMDLQDGHLLLRGLSSDEITKAFRASHGLSTDQL